MDAAGSPMSMRRLVSLEVALGVAFPASGWLVGFRSPLLVPTSFASWWRADLVGVVTPVMWLGGLALSMWLLSTMALYGWATRRGHAGLRRIVGAWTAPAVRRAIDAAVVVSIGTAALVAPARAFGATAPHPTGAAVSSTSASSTAPPANTTVSPPGSTAPVVRSGSALGGRASVPVAAAPVVRAGTSSVRAEAPGLRAGPDLRPSSATTRPPTTRRTTLPTPTRPTQAPTTASVPTALPAVRAGATGSTSDAGVPAVPTPRPTGVTAMRPPLPTSAARPTGTTPPPGTTPPAVGPAGTVDGATTIHHVVAAGESLWSIASTRRRATGGVATTEAEVARYWARVVAVNRAALRSGNPSLVYAGELLELPPAT